MFCRSPPVCHAVIPVSFDTAFKIMDGLRAVGFVHSKGVTVVLPGTGGIQHYVVAYKGIDGADELLAMKCDRHHHAALRADK
jgi:hypothetical protein